MSLNFDGVQNVVLLFSDPDYEDAVSTIVKNLTAVSSDIAYSDDVTDNLTVLSPKYASTDNGLLQGLLYVPDLDGDDPCQDQERTFVPSSVVRQSNLPSTNYNLIAIAPWFSKNCTKSYLASSRFDPIRAFIFYIPSNDTTTPPDSNSDVWDLGDGGAWKSANHFPIFAVSGALGTEMTYQLSLYSGNVTDVPFGDEIIQLYHPDPDDYVRIWTELTVSTPTGLPNVWIFILAVIGVLVGVILLTFFGMQYLWWQRRVLLRRRVIDGELNLEAMGIKRLTVPLHHVQKFPLFTYNYDPPPPSPLPQPELPQSVSVPSSPTHTTSPTPPSPSSMLASRQLSQRRKSQPSQQHSSIDAAIGENAGNAAFDVRSQAYAYTDEEAQSHISDPASATTVPVSPTSIASAPEHSVVGDLDYQPMCHICLDPFESLVTIIRELPCGHIFHSECIDGFLSCVSSLCPLCKACMLPRGYCPPITNVMVRRERAMRKLRERVDMSNTQTKASRGRIYSWSSSLRKHITCASDPTQDRQPAIELKQHPTGRPNQGAVLATSEATRRRMAELAGVGTEMDAVDVTWRTKAKLAFSRIFPFR